MADDTLTTVDWLGRDQPLSRKALQLTTSGGGGAVTSPVTPPSGAMGPAGQRNLTPPLPGTPGANPLGISLGALRLAQALSPLASGGVPQPGSDAVTKEGAFAGEVGGVPSQALAPSAGPEAVTPAGAFAGEVGGVGQTDVSGSAGTSGVELATGAAADTGSAALTLAGTGYGAYNLSKSHEPDYIKALHATDLALGVASIAFPVLGIVSGVIEAGIAIAEAAGALTPGPYGPTRARSAKEASADLLGLHQADMAAAQSGDLTQIQAALGSKQGPRGEVRSNLSLDPSVAQSLGISGITDWSALSPDQFQSLLGYFQKNPEAIDTAVTGSGDVAYLPANVATQVGDNAALQAKSLLKALVAAMPQPAEPQPIQPAPLTASGPAGALGFATDLLGQA